MAISDDIRQLVKREQDIQGVIGVLDTYLSNKSKAREAFKPAVAKVDSSQQNTSIYKKNLMTTLNNKTGEIISIYGEEDGNELINSLSNQINEMTAINSGTFTNTKNIINDTTELDLNVYNVKTNQNEKIPSKLYLSNKDNYKLKADITAQNQIIDDKEKERSKNLKVNIRRKREVHDKLTKNYQNDLSVLEKSGNNDLKKKVFNVQEDIIRDTYLATNPSFSDSDIVIFSGLDAIDKFIKSEGLVINEENRKDARKFIESKQREFYENPSQYVKDGNKIIMMNDIILSPDSDLRMILNLDNPDISSESRINSNSITIE